MGNLAQAGFPDRVADRKILWRDPALVALKLRLQRHDAVSFVYRVATCFNSFDI